MLQIGGQRIPTKTLFLIASDCVLILLGLTLATVVRFFNAGTGRAHLHDLQTLGRFALVVLVCEVTLYYNDLYNPQVVSRWSEMSLRLLQAFGVSCLALAILYYFAPDAGLGRGVAVLALPTTLVLLLAWRLSLDATGFVPGGPERVLVLGTGPAGISLVREIISRPELHFKVVGFLDEMGENIGKSLVNPGIIGGVAEVETLVVREKIDRVILSLAERRGRTPVSQLLQLKFAGVKVEDAHSCNERISGRIVLEHLSPSWLILSNGFRKSRLLFASKRILDIAVSAIALLLTLPFMAVVAAAIWLETGRPILFRQNRTGLGGKEFEIIKFRSMYQNAEANGPSWAANDDRRITRVGKFIRKFRLDELPQVFNVFRGEMSLVGPRPERPYFCQMLEQHSPYYVLRHSVRPGITGWAQVRYQYGSSIEESKTKLEFDLFYIKHMSLFLDLAIFFETAKVILYRRGAK
jgi:sugar transferase (PEP-CTERM system associated)